MALYLITGIAGFIGSSIARGLLAQGDDVRGIDNFSTGKRDNIAEIIGRMDFREADLLNLDAVHDACRGVDYIFHEAAIPSVPKSVLDPLGNAVHTVLSGDIVGCSIAIIGCGPIGLFAIAVARAVGASTVFAIELNEHRRKLAKAMKADHVCDPSKGNV